MSQRWIGPDDEGFADLFTTFSASAYRLEGRQDYNEPNEAEALARFVAGQPADLDTSGWERMLRANRAAGRTVTRVRVIVEPLTDYTRLELAVYPSLVAAGEDIRVIAVGAGQWPAELPRKDYWMFDDQRVWLMHYDEAGTFAGAELLDYPDDVARHIRWRDSALAQSVPLAAYTARLQRLS